MSSTFSNLKFELITTGEQSGSWGSTTNANIGTAIEQAVVGMATLTSADFTANVATLTLTNTNAAQNARALCLNIAAGAVSAAGTINVPAIQKPYLIINGSSYTVTVKVSGQTGIAVPSGKRTVVYNNATDVGNQIDYLATLALGTALPITSGGTGTTSTTFVNLASNVTGTLPIANGGTGTTSTTFANLTTNVTGTLPIANGGTNATTASGARTNLGVAIGTDVPSTTGGGASGTWGINISGNAATASAVTSFATANWTIEQSGTNLVFKYNGTTVASISSAGVASMAGLSTTGSITAGGTVTANGT
jgi:hypothetical protein